MYYQWAEVHEYCQTRLVSMFII